MELAAYTERDQSRVADSLALREIDAARVLNISPRKLWTLRKQNRVPFVQIGRVVRYPRHLLVLWLEEQASLAAASSKPRQQTRDGEVANG